MSLLQRCPLRGVPLYGVSLSVCSNLLVVVVGLDVVNDGLECGFAHGATIGHLGPLHNTHKTKWMWEESRILPFSLLLAVRVAIVYMRLHYIYNTGCLCSIKHRSQAPNTISALIKAPL